MDGWIMRGSGIVLLVGAIAIAFWPRASTTEPEAASRPLEVPRVRAASGFTLAFAAPNGRAVSVASWVGDGGVAPSVDAAVDEPPAATGVLARAITSALCPTAAHLICGARTHAGCGPMQPAYDDEGIEVPVSCVPTVQQQCADWALNQYGGVPDDLALDEGALAACVDALRVDASRGQGISPDPVCNELARDPANEGEACVAEWVPCGAAGQCYDGRCEPSARLGEPCVDEPCVRGLFCTAGLCERPTPRGGACDDDSTCERRGDYCLDGVCAPHVPERGACEYDGECGLASRCVLGRCARVPSTRCTLDEECGRGRTCLGPYAARCEAIPSVGARCVNAVDCEPWLGCFDGHCGAFGRVRGGGLRVGERCEAASCVADAMCVWRVEDGSCASALCGMNEYFAELSSGQE